MEFKRRSMTVTIDGYTIALVEPIRQEIIAAGKNARETGANGQPYTNMDLMRANLTCAMVESWKDPKNNLVAKEEVEKAIKDGLPNAFYSKLLAACDVLLAETEEDKAFLDKITPKAPKTTSSKP